VCWLSFEADAARLRANCAADRLIENGDEVARLAEPVAAAIARPSAQMLDIPIDHAGTPFQQLVWQALRAIPCGETRTYGALAAAFGKPGASRAIGGANAANRIAVLIPCHRVIASDGSLGGYAWGLEIKAALLRREGAVGGGLLL
jgi:AraC family transcriptional regulator of adaptative response/methylated-DNA-[protein]-cysteine methyltransferase